VLVSGLGSGVVAIDASGDANCVRKSDGTAWCWGSNVDGPPGYASTAEVVNRLVSKLGSTPRKALPRASDPMGLELIELPRSADAALASSSDALTRAADRPSTLTNPEDIAALTPVSHHEQCARKFARTRSILLATFSAAARWSTPAAGAVRSSLRTNGPQSRFPRRNGFEAIPDPGRRAIGQYGGLESP
jgi:hypothetical protein